jgi:hypothetical protein
MIEYIDSLGPWVEMLAFFVLGVWAGRRWAYVKHQAECRARNCGTIKQMRTDAMQLSADKRSLENNNEFMRAVVEQKVKDIHSLKTSNGIMAKEIEKLTYQLPRPTRRMVA